MRCVPAGTHCEARDRGRTGTYHTVPMEQRLLADYEPLFLQVAHVETEAVGTDYRYATRWGLRCVGALQRSRAVSVLDGDMTQCFRRRTTGRSLDGTTTATVLVGIMRATRGWACGLQGLTLV